MKVSLRTIVAVCAVCAVGVVAGAVMLGAPTKALATNYYNNNSGSDYMYTTNLYFTNPHGNFNLRVWVVKSNWFVSDRYSISMYDNAGRLVWSGGNQGDRTYAIGGNVTRISLLRTSQGATTYWQRK